VRKTARRARTAAARTTCHRADARTRGLRNWAVAPLFEKWLEEHFPDRTDKVLNRVSDLRGGKLYEVTYRKLGLNEKDYELDASFLSETDRAGDVVLSAG